MTVTELIDKLKALFGRWRFKQRVASVGGRLFGDRRWEDVQLAQMTGKLSARGNRLFDWFYRSGIRLHRLSCGCPAFRPTDHAWDRLHQVLYNYGRPQSQHARWRQRYDRGR